MINEEENKIWKKYAKRRRKLMNLVSELYPQQQNAIADVYDEAAMDAIEYARRLQAFHDLYAEKYGVAAADAFEKESFGEKIADTFADDLAYIAADSSLYQYSIGKKNVK